MSHFVIRGGKTLAGNIPVYGSKNAALPLLTASLLTDGVIRYKNIPAILDVHRLLSILETIGVKVSRTGDEVQLEAGKLNPDHLPQDAIGMLRGSILLMGALLGRFRRATLPRPGGDIIGARPIEAHLDAFRQLGATIGEMKQNITIDGSNLKAGRVVLQEFSVTATENILLLAATLPGKTVIEIAACEPHVVVLAQLLVAMGARISGAGTHTIVVEGTKKLHTAFVTNIPDMLEAGAFILMGAVTQSHLHINNVPIEHLDLFFKKLDDIGINYTIDAATAQVTTAPGTLRSFKMQALPHPGIATDLQTPFAVVATQAEGSSLIHDPMYEGRFRHISELQKMGASVTVCDPHRVIILGPTTLHGRKLQSLDIRSGLTLLIAGLVAGGETIIEHAEIIDRGYADLTTRLKAIGADIERIDK